MRFAAILAALWALWAPAYALTPGQRVVLAASPCRGVAVSVAFGNNSPVCYNGQRVGSYASIPGWSYTGAVSGTGATVRTATDSAGNIITFANNVPRITNQGILIEAAAFNALLQSQAFGTFWTTSATTPASGVGIAPDGSATASTVADTATNARHIIYQDTTSIPNSTVSTFSVYQRQNTLRYSQISLAGAASVPFYGAVFDLQVGAITDTRGLNSPLNTNASIKSGVGGWYRSALTMTSPLTSSTTDTFAIIATSNSGTPAYDSNGNPTYAGTAQSIYVWGAQLEMGSSASSYIPTTTNPVTRSADSLTVSFSGAPKLATIYYGQSSATTINNPASPLNLGASSGGAWVGSYITRVVIK